MHDYQNLYRVPYPSENTTSKNTAATDLQYRDLAYIYPVSMKMGDMGENFEVWEDIPIPVRCSFQDMALDTQHTDPNISGSRYARIFTREPNSMRWHDKVVVRGVSMLCVKVIERFDNYTGVFNHLEARALFLSAEEELPPDA